MASILYLGDNHPGSTSRHRAEALVRLGHEVHTEDPYDASSGIRGGGLENAIHYRTGYRFVQGRVRKWIGRVLSQATAIDVILVDNGEFFGPSVLRQLKASGKPVILYNQDDPTGKRDGRRFDLLRKALPLYDLVAVCRTQTRNEAIALGAIKVILVRMGYDEVAHRPFDSVEDIPEQFRSQIAFIGTCMPGENRDAFMLHLIEQQLPVSIWGGRWEKSPHWEKLKPYFRGSSLSGRDYVAAMQGAEICIGLLSKGNRDLYTTRTFEIPYAGGLFCGERTSDHQAFYQEGEEAVFWADAAECAVVCKRLLSDDVLRQNIRAAGAAKVRRLQVGNESLVATLLKEAGVV